MSHPPRLLCSDMQQFAADGGEAPASAGGGRSATAIPCIQVLPDCHDFAKWALCNGVSSGSVRCAVQQWSCLPHDLQTELSPCPADGACRRADQGHRACPEAPSIHQIGEQPLCSLVQTAHCLCTFHFALLPETDQGNLAAVYTELSIYGRS